MWWPSEPALPERRNTSFRKEKYKFFWTMLFHRGVFLDERYRERKLNVLQLDPRFTNVASHRRDILPECVVNLVRVWFPNPKNIPYMRHRWQLFFFKLKTILLYTLFLFKSENFVQNFFLLEFVFVKITSALDSYLVTERFV